MRLKMSVLILALAASASMPAMAQSSYNGANTGAGTAYTTNNQIYNSAPNAYYSSNQGVTPLYNSNSQPLSINQYVAGKNAPSYNYGGTQPYAFGNNNISSYSSLTPDQFQSLQRQAQANANTGQQFGSNGQPLNPQQMAANGQYAGMYQPPAEMFAQGTDGSALQKLLGQQDDQKPKIKKVMKYKTMNNPLEAPPRLFNPDQ